MAALLREADGIVVLRVVKPDGLPGGMMQTVDVDKRGHAHTAHLQHLDL